MTPQLLIQKIKAVLEVAPAFDDAHARTLAEAYAQLTRETNTRLDQCRDLIGRQMFSEALSVAEAAPALLDLCALLSFQGIDAWTELCAFGGWPAPEPVPADAGALKALKDAYASNRILEPLQKVFRTAVRLGMTREALQILGHLEKADPANPAWRQNRAEFERKRLGEIRAEFEACRTTPEEPALRTLLGEIAAMTCCSDDALANELAAICDRLERERLNAAALRMLDQLGSAYSALNLEEGRRNAERYRQLLETGKVTETEVMRRQREEATAWVEEENRKAQAEADFRDAQAALRTLVEESSAEGVDEALARLESFGRTEEEGAHDLFERARALSARNLRARRLRQLTLAGLSVASALAVVATAALFVRQQCLEKRVSENVADLQRAFDAEDADRFSEKLAELEQDNAAVWHDERVQAEARRVEDLRKNIENREVRFQACLRTFAAARTDTTACQTPVCERLLNEARLLAVTPSQKQRLAASEQEWAAYRDQRISGDNETLKQLCESLEEGLNNVQTALSGGLFAEAFHALQNIETKKAERDRLSYADNDSLLSRYSRVTNRLAGAQAELTGRDSRIRALGSASTVTAYFDALNTYAGNYPDCPLVRTFNRVLERKEDYVRFDQTRPGHIWTEHLRGIEEVRQLAGMVEGLLKTPGYSELWCVKARNLATAREQDFYFPSEPRSVVGNPQLRPGERAKLYQEVYFNDMGKFEQRFEKKVLNLEVQAGPFFVAACGKIPPVLSQLRKRLDKPEPSCRAAIVEFFQALASETALPTRLRISLIDQLSLKQPEISRLRREYLPAVEPVFFDRLVFQRAELEHGVNKMLADFASALEQTEEAKVRDALQAKANTRDVRFIGYVDREGKLTLRDVGPNAVCELWLLNPETLRPLVAYERRGTEWSPVEGVPAPAPFTPLFAPFDRQSTRDHLQVLRKIECFKPDMFPRLWPENMRELPKIAKGEKQ